MRIVYCLNALCYGGGIERVTIAKANALAEVNGNEVWILVTDNDFELPSKLSEKVHLVDLGIRYYHNQSPIPFIDVWKEGIKRHRHKAVLKTELERIKPDILIAVGQAEKYILPSLNLSSRPACIREIHYYKYYRRDFADNWQKRLIARMAEWYDYGWRIRKYDAVVALTELDKRRYWHNDDLVHVIPNPVVAQPMRRASGEKKVVMAVGRLAAQKNFASLLNAWQWVEGRHPDWCLQIWGEGAERIALLQKIQELRLTSAHLMGYEPDIMNRYSQASVLAVTSRYEGFPMIIVEAMAAGIPVVSYDCPCGPSDIISEGEDGFLVTPGDEKALAEKICWLMEHDERRREMGMNALKKSSCYSLDKITEKWMDLFRQLR